MKVELERLWDVATAPAGSLPEIFEDLVEAAQHVKRSERAGAAAFDGELFAPIAPRWDDVRWQIERILVRSAETIDAAAEALKEVVRRYAETDEVAAHLPEEILRKL